ncbi:O-antigen ligase family protein [candidate division TA06 bacterium]|uniref:O-antigen ligase family protein n=1 Tax=candidate division TA06 bacterium TaxID=2250710 RepID=A0A933IA13_UNCT6|nr:O-antigen ligase family protein [candidate division TA06 bacterium]
MMNKNMAANFLDQTTQLAMVGFVASLPVSIAFTQSSLFAGWVAWLLKCLVEKRWNGFKTPLDLGIGLFLASALLSTVFSLSPWESFISLKKFYLLSAVYFTGFNVKSPARLLELVKLFLGMTALTGVYGLVMFWFGYQPRLLAAQGMAMTSGGIFMMAGLLSLAWIQYQLGSPGRRQRLHSLAAAALLAASLILTRTVSSWFGFVMGFPALIRSWKRRTAVFLLAALLLAGVFYSANNYQMSFKLYSGNKATSWNMRLGFWRMGWQLIKERPVLGTGSIDLGQILKGMRTAEDEKLWQGIPMGGHLHNNFIQIAATRGFVGLAAFLFMWFSIFALAAKLMGSRSRLTGIFAGGIMAALTGFQINGLAEWNFSDSEVVTIVWVMAGLLLALHRFNIDGILKDEPKKHEAVI